MPRSLDYVSIEAAKAAGGMRLVLNAGVPGPWSEAAKAIFRIKGVSFLPVAHQGGMDNKELADWTGLANAPVALYGDERPRGHWSEILLLAERLAPEPSLVPRDERQRTAMFGLAHEICGEDGLGWNRRLQLLEHSEASARARAALKDPSALNRPNAPIARMRHRYSPNHDLAAAEARIVAILEHLASVLAVQAAAGSPWLVGEALTAADIYWAAFCNMFAPMAPDLCPMPDFYRAAASVVTPAVQAALASTLIAHRDRIAAICFETPMRF